MQVNTEFYGAPETWIKNTTIDNVDTTPELYWFKVADINPDSASAFNRKSRLIDYVNDNKLEFGEDIDPSICYAGMSGGPLVNVEMYNGVQDENHNQEIKITSDIFENPCGWFFATMTDVSPTLGQGFAGASYLTDSNYDYFDIIGKYYWKIDDKTIVYDSLLNVSASLQPIVEFNPRGLYMAIKVTIFNKTSGSFNNYTAETVRANFANNTFDPDIHVIVRAYVEIYARRSASENYFEVDTYSSSGLIAVPIKHALINSHDVINYGYRNNQFTLMGWNGGNPSAAKFNHEGDTPSLDDDKYYPFQRCNNINPPGNSSTADTPRGNIWVNTQETRVFQEAMNNSQIGIVSYIEYSEANMEAIRKAAACFGLFFTEKAGTYYSSDPDKWTDADMFCGLLSEGVGYGEYTRGEGNRDNPVYEYSSSQDSPFKPGGNDPNQYSNTTYFNTLTSNASLLKCYVLDANNVELLGDDLWTICDSISAEDWDNFDGKIKDEFLTTNPIDSIISLIRYPFNIPHTFNPSKVNVQLGKSTGRAQGYRTYNSIFGVDFTGKKIYPRFGNSFLDYSPYTKYELYIPFCGTVEISPGDILGHTLNLSLRIDLLTGSVIVYIMADSLVIATAKGSCGVEQVLNGTQSATVNSNIINGLITYSGIDTQRNAQFGRAVYPTGVIKDVLDPFGQQQAFASLNTQREQAEFNLTHIDTPIHKMGSPSPLLAWIQEFNARLIIYYPEGDVISSTQPPSLNEAAIRSFGHIKGFATATPGIVRDFQSSTNQNYLRGDIVTDSIPCTSNERARIRSLFADGVYLPVLTT